MGCIAESLERRVLLAANLPLDTLPPSLADASKPPELELDHDHEDLTLTYLPPQHHLFKRGGHLSKASRAKPADIALRFLKSNAAKLGLQGADLTDVIVTDQHISQHTGVTHIYLRQRIDGLEITNANLVVNVTRDGRVLNVGGGFVPGINLLVQRGQPALLPSQALEHAAKGLDLNLPAPALIHSRAHGGGFLLSAPDLSLDEIPSKLHYVATPDGVQLAWGLVLRTPDGDHWYDVAIDAATGQRLATSDWVDAASYNVFPIPLESPSDGPRTIMVDPHNPLASPYGWHDTNGAPGAEFTDTRGNNVYAQEDRDANNSAGFRPSGGSSLVFDFPLDLNQDPVNYQSASITNLFYWNNLVHDVYFHYGFTESAGNFQVRNYTGQGLGNDQVWADAQDGSGLNNANFATPPDGQAPRMQMYLWDRTNPRRDGDLDNGIIIHEYTHGLSNRLTGGPSNVSALDAQQSGAMGEGWSDWYALVLSMKDTDAKEGAYGIGTYSLGQSPNGVGIRRYPYSFDMAVNPLTYGAYNSNNQVHAAGEIWASALWDLNMLLVERYGFNPNIYGAWNSGGNNTALQLVTDAMKLQPANPTFLQGRDAILLADQALTGGANQRLIWYAFARRGMGQSAYDGGNANALAVTEAFDLPSGLFSPFVISQTPRTLQVLPVGSMDFIFDEAMDASSFSIADDVVSFTAPDGSSLLSQITASTWADSKTLRISFNPQSADGLYELTIGPNIRSAIDGDVMDQDLDGNIGESVDDRYIGRFRIQRRIGPDGFGYEATAYALESIDLVPGAAGVFTILDNLDDGTASVSLGSNSFSFYGVNYTGANQLYVSTNGLITFGGTMSGDYNNRDLTTLPSLPAISPLWDDWRTDLELKDQVLGQFEDANGDGTPERLIIEWNWVQHYSYTSSTASFHAILQLNTGANPGVITFQFLDLMLNDARWNNGASATVGIKAGGSQGVNRLLVSYNNGSSPYVGTGKALRFAKQDATANGMIAGHLFDDAAGDGAKNNGDGGLGGWTIHLDRNIDGTTDYVAATGPDGNYSFSGLPAGNYRVRAVTQNGWLQTSANPADIVLAAGQNATASDIGNFKRITLSGTVWDDWIGNGTREHTDNGLTGWTIQLDKDANGSVDSTTTTTTDGNYSFANLGPGTYRVRAVLPSGWMQLTADPADEVAASGINVVGKNYGVFKKISISGQVFSDTNANGAKDSGEVGLPGWTVQLDRNADGSVDATTLSDASGNYSFADQGPGLYRVRQLLQADWAQTTTNPADITAYSATNVSGVLFGNFASGAGVLLAQGVNVSGVEGTPLNNVLVATFSDSDGNTDPAAYSATINWGDGTSTAGTVVAAGAQFQVRGSRTYTTYGSYPVGVSIVDADGSSASTSSNASIAGAPINATGKNFNASRKTSFTAVVATFTDSNPFGSLGDYTATIHWGEGNSKSTGSILYNSSTGLFEVRGTHTYKRGGIFTVTVTITDGGTTATVTGTVSVS